MKIISMVKNMGPTGDSITYDITISIARHLVEANDVTRLKDIEGPFIYMYETLEQFIH